MQILSDGRQIAKVYEDGKIDLQFAMDSNFSINKQFGELKAQLDLRTPHQPTIANGVVNHIVFSAEPKEKIVAVLKALGLEVQTFELAYLARTGWRFQKTKMGYPDRSVYYPGIKFYSSPTEAQEDLQNVQTNNPDFVWKLVGPHGIDFPCDAGSYSIIGYRNRELAG